MSNLIRKRLDISLKSEEVKELVSLYLLQKALSELKREEVDAVYKEVLEKIPVFSQQNDRIMDYKLLYLASNKDAMSIYNEVDRLLYERKIKPPEMEPGYCPALTEECRLTEIEHEIVRVVGNAIGITVDKLLSTGLEEYERFINLVVCSVVNSPNFENPLNKYIQNNTQTI